MLLYTNTNPTDNRMAQELAGSWQMADGRWQVHYVAAGVCIRVMLTMMDNNKKEKSKRGAYVIAVVKSVIDEDCTTQHCGVVIENGIEDGDTAVTAT